jgi:hypothetical protein
MVQANEWVAGGNQEMDSGATQSIFPLATKRAGTNPSLKIC